MVMNSKVHPSNRKKVPAAAWESFFCWRRLLTKGPITNQCFRQATPPSERNTYQSILGPRRMRTADICSHAALPKFTSNQQPAWCKTLMCVRLVTEVISRPIKRHRCLYRHFACLCVLSPKKTTQTRCGSLSKSTFFSWLRFYGNSSLSVCTRLMCLVGRGRSKPSVSRGGAKKG